MTEAAERPGAGTITIEWVLGWDPADATTYGWQLRADPPLPDELVARLLAEIAKVY
jgi:hypothetical protein